MAPEFVVRIGGFKTGESPRTLFRTKIHPLENIQQEQRVNYVVENTCTPLPMPVLLSYLVVEVGVLWIGSEFLQTPC